VGEVWAAQGVGGPHRWKGYWEGILEGSLEEAVCPTVWPVSRVRPCSQVSLHCATSLQSPFGCSVTGAVNRLLFLCLELSSWQVAPVLGRPYQEASSHPSPNLNHSGVPLTAAKR
jgi:hypothetical protein